MLGSAGPTILSFMGVMGTGSALAELSGGERVCRTLAKAGRPTLTATEEDVNEILCHELETPFTLEKQRLAPPTEAVRTPRIISHLRFDIPIPMSDLECDPVSQGPKHPTPPRIARQYHHDDTTHIHWHFGRRGGRDSPRRSRLRDARSRRTTPAQDSPLARIQPHRDERPKARRALQGIRLRLDGRLGLRLCPDPNLLLAVVQPQGLDDV